MLFLVDILAILTHSHEVCPVQMNDKHTRDGLKLPCTQLFAISRCTQYSPVLKTW